MRFLCTVCQENFIPESTVVAVECGHLYHEVCIGTWMSKKKSCPQCRLQLKKNTQRLYFNFEESEILDADSLQYKVDQLSYKLETVKTHAEEDSKKLIEERVISSDLRKRVLALESEVQNNKSVINRLKMEVKIAFKLEEERNLLKKELETKKDLEVKYASIRDMIDGTADKVKKRLETLPRTPVSFTNLCTFVEALKTELERVRRYCKRQEVEVEKKSRETKTLQSKILELEEIVKKRQQPESETVTKRKRMDNEVIPEAKTNTSLSTKPNFQLAMQKTSQISIPKQQEKKDSFAFKKNFHSSRMLTAAASAGFGKRVPTVYDGFGGSKPVSLATPTPREEIIQLIHKRSKS